MWEKGVWMDPDINLYDLEHMVTRDPRMTRQEWQELYWSAWRTFYTPEHIETILRRAAASNCAMSRLQGNLYACSTTPELEGITPYQGGVLRRKYRRDRRPGMPIEPIWAFYPKLVSEFVTKNSRAIGKAIWIARLCHRIRKDPNRYAYTDQAMRSVSADETETLEQFTQNEAARQAVEHTHMVARLTGRNSLAAADASA